LSIKEEYSANTYSLRSLCHEVLVREAVTLGFGLRTQVPEPMNNQPFFRYDHMNEINRVQRSARPILDALRTSLVDLVDADEDEALAALAAFLRVRFRKTLKLTWTDLPGSEVPLERLISVVDEYLAEDLDRPKRTQALVAAAFDLIFEDNRSRKINDPS